MVLAPDDGADGDAAVPLHLVDADAFDAWSATQPDRVRTWLATTGFAARSGQVALVSDDAGALTLAVVGHGTARDRARDRFMLGGAVAKLPAARYALHHGLEPQDLETEALGWLLAGYRYRRFRAGQGADGGSGWPQLVAPAGVDRARLETLAAAEALTRDLINTPAGHMGPAELEAVFLDVAARFGADTAVIAGDDLLAADLPLIHAVGRASPRAPRLLDLRWGAAGPRLTLVGKGVCFDTGGLNLKPGGSMGLMKKDMGGAATVLGLAWAIMAQGWPVRLRVLIPAVENAVDGSAMRPGDILTSRKGLTVEVNNTDAEGRLVLADALALADEEAPAAMVCMATLTGAARVALGPDVPPFYTEDDALAAALAEAAARVRDPLWRMPLHRGYAAMIEPGIADLDNAPSGGMAGSVTAALFLERFVESAARFVHMDIYGWRPAAANACPKGGVGQGARALFAALPGVLRL
ncbi:MAG: leucyl aminopeptidase family protein [Rhodobacteraceae bacterium]|nr:leucyl aminopeptidase family protein [Paracoccaceae bacterium]